MRGKAACDLDMVKLDMADKKEIDDLRSKASSATRWSLITEGIVKLISPLIQIVLAHVLAPEAFGVVATVTMVTSFADMLSDAGFQKYLVQHDFSSKKELEDRASVAFWTNLAISLLLWGVITLFCDPLATLVGSPGLGVVLVVACASLPLTALSSIQLAIFHRSFSFKELFPVRVSVAAVPLIVTVPLALLGFGFWSLVIGTLAGSAVNAAVLTLSSSWRPSLHYSFQELREMLSFSIWTLLEQLSVWLISWAGTFIVGSLLSEYYLGLYKTSISMVNSAMGIVTSATTPILFAELSRLQNDERAFEDAFLEMQRKVSLFVMPLGVGIFVFRDFATNLLLGPQWAEASFMLGLWALSGSFVIMYSHYASEVYRAKGRPRLSFFNHCVYLAVLLPVTYWGACQSFDVFAMACALVRIAGIAISFATLQWRIGMHVLSIVRGTAPVLCSSLLMGAVGVASLTVGIPEPVGIAVCIASYFAFSILSKETRKELVGWGGAMVRRFGNRPRP